MHKYQLITSPSGEEMVVLSREDFDRLAAAFDAINEDDEDVAIYDARKAELTEGTKLPPEVSLAILRGESRLRAIRKYKELSQSDLARMANKAQGFISDLENGRRNINDATAQGLAAVLDVPVEWLKG